MYEEIHAKDERARGKVQKSLVIRFRERIPFQQKNINARRNISICVSMVTFTFNYLRFCPLFP